MSILDFIFDNWYITFFLLWFIFSMFSGGEKEQRRARRESPPVHRDPVLERQQEELRRRAAQKEASQRQLPPEPAPKKRTFFDELEDLKKTIQQQVEVIKEEFEEELEPLPRREPLPQTVPNTVTPTYRTETIETEEPVALGKQITTQLATEAHKATEEHQTTKVRDEERDLIPETVQPSSASTPKRSHTFRQQLAMGPQTLRQAVIWAEILGPPRAKKPLQSFYHQQ